MWPTDLDLDRDLAEHDQDLDPHPIGGQYAGVAWGLAERQDDPAPDPR